MDSHTIHNLCRHLVCCKIFILFLKSEVIPHHILCLEQILVLQVLHSQSHSRKVITVHNKNHILRIICKLVCQLFDKIIHLMDLIYVIFPFIVLFLSRRTGNCDLRILQNLLIRICTMSLYGNSIYIIRPLSRIQTFQNFICQNLILYPAIWILLVLSCHVLFRSKSIKSEIRENRSSSIEVCLIIMNRMGGIAHILQYVRCTLTGSLSQNTLIRIFPGSEIMHTHSCNGFKLRICSTCTYRRNLIISGGIFLHQLSERRDRIFRNIQIVYQCGIKE